MPILDAALQQRVADQHIEAERRGRHAPHTGGQDRVERSRIVENHIQPFRTHTLGFVLDGGAVVVGQDAQHPLGVGTADRRANIGQNHSGLPRSRTGTIPVAVEFFRNPLARIGRWNLACQRSNGTLGTQRLP